MTTTPRIGILLFDDAEELDFVGPFEVFTMAAFDVTLIGPSREPVRCAKGMRFLPDTTLESCGRLDVLLVPGGQGTRREVLNQALLDWIAAIDESTAWTTGVCTGAMLLTAAGPARGKRVTTHWAFVETLRKRGEAAEVLDNYRYVRDGKIVTSAGVSAGIDMALWLTGQLRDPALARRVQRNMQYDPAPPYAALA